LLLFALREVDPTDTRLITFDHDSGEPCLPTLVAFQIPVKIQNIIVHNCIIDEGASTCIMSKMMWQKLGSPELIPSAITLRAYDGRPSSPEGVFQNVPIELGGKTILIDIEVIDALLDDNILFVHSYMYVMNVVAPSMFHTMMFPQNGKTITINQLYHYDPNPSSNIDNILPFVPQAITQIPFFYPPPGVQSFQVAKMITLPNMVLTILVWYLHPPKMVPQPSLPPQTEGIPMQIPILTPTTPPTPPLTSTTATSRGKRKKKDLIAPLPPHVQPLCTL
jgi:hypothetical protein